MRFSVRIDPDAFEDIQEGITYYNQQRSGLGVKFHKMIMSHFKTLESNPYFKVRYDKVHCIPVKKYPYMIHYTLEKANRLIIIHGVINTNRDPKHWGRKG